MKGTAHPCMTSLCVLSRTQSRRIFAGHWTDKNGVLNRTGYFPGKKNPQAMSASGCAMDEAMDNDRLFVSWLSENGASFPKLEWPVFSWPGQPHDGERGVLVTEVRFWAIADTSVSNSRNSCT